MEHGKKASVRVVFSAVHAYFYYCLLRGGKQSQAGQTYDYDFSGEEHADDADAA